MTDTLKPDTPGALVHWTCSREEWKRFMRWKKMKEGILHYILYRFTPWRNLKTPDIIITQKEVGMDDITEYFHTDSRELRRVNIRDAGKMNIMEITYETITSKLPDYTDIYIPVPKGKLREAIELQEYLLYYYQPPAHTVRP